MNLTDIYFNDENLNDIIGSRIINHNLTNLPDRDVKIYTIARSNSSVVTSAGFIKKDLTVDFYIKGCDRTEGESILSRLKMLTQCKNKDLQVYQGIFYDTTGDDDYIGESIIFKQSTLQGTSMQWFGGTCMITLSFVTAEPIAYGTSDQTLNSSTKTTSTHSITLTDVKGTFIEQYPRFELTYNSVTYGSSSELKLTDGTKVMSIEKQISAGSVLVVDSSSGIVTVDDEPVTYYGILPVVAPGDSSFDIVDNYTARNISVSITSTPRYI